MAYFTNFLKSMTPYSDLTRACDFITNGNCGFTGNAGIWEDQLPSLLFQNYGSYKTPARSDREA